MSGLERRLAGVELPDEEAARERAWRVVRAAGARREPLPRRRRLALVPVVVALALAALAGAALTPPGRAVIDSVREAVGVENAAPALTSLPAPGRLLVVSGAGPWIVQQDGSKRLLGAWDDASWSPNGLFVVAVRGRRLAALDPRGEVRWSLSRSARLADPRWAPSGFRIAYRAGAGLRVVAGDGTGDRALAARVDPVAPAWRPGEEHVLAFVRDRRVHVVETDTGRTLWRSPRGPRVAGIAWTADGRLVVRSRRLLRVFEAGRRLLRMPIGDGRAFTAAAPSPDGRFLALGVERRDGEAAVLLHDLEQNVSRELFAGAGSFSGLAWSPGGDWLLLEWPAANQWAFVRAPGVRRIAAVSDVAREFAPGGLGRPPFPRVAGWCCR